MTTRASGATRGGGDGIHNEDAFVVDEGLGLYVVCDGESTRPAGEVASRLAADSVTRTIEEARASGDPDGAGFGEEVMGEEVMERALRAALAAVARTGDADPQLAGLSTTVTVLLMHRRFAVIGHSGDSRVYLIRDGRISQLTHDHQDTEARPAEPAHPTSSDFDVFTAAIEPGDTLALCSDGAARAVRDPALVRAASDLSPNVLASRIVSAANRSASDQDSTVVIVRALPERRPGWLSLSGPARATRFGHVVDAWSHDHEDEALDASSRRETHSEESG